VQLLVALTPCNKVLEGIVFKNNTLHNSSRGTEWGVENRCFMEQVSSMLNAYFHSFSFAPTEHFIKAWGAAKRNPMLHS